MKTLPCELPYEMFMELRTTTPLQRLNQTEAEAVFEKLSELGFKVAQKNGRPS